MNKTLADRLLIVAPYIVMLEVVFLTTLTVGDTLIKHFG
jgi:hypothetical protein